MPAISAVLQCIVQIAHDCDRAEVDRILVREAVLLVSGYERELMDVSVQVGQRRIR